MKKKTAFLNKRARKNRYLHVDKNKARLYISHPVSKSIPKNQRSQYNTQSSEITTESLNLRYKKWERGPTEELKLRLGLGFLIQGLWVAYNHRSSREVVEI